VVDQDGVPGLLHAVGQRGQARVGGQAEARSGLVRRDGAQHLGLAQHVEHQLDLARGPGARAGSPGGEHQLLDLELEQQRVQQLTLAPQHLRQLLHHQLQRPLGPAPGTARAVLDRGIGRCGGRLRETLAISVDTSD
jgi:hypothetical protein